jgi:gliding motility-associated-like protein
MIKKLLLQLFIFFGLTAVALAQGTPISVGTQVTTFSSMIRGYHFTAPTSFTICGLYIPPDANPTGTQTIRVVKFTAGPPPAFAATTNSFIQLFTITNAPATQVVACNIPIAAGEIIGVYGARGANCINSYGPANFVTSINGFNTTLQRSGMQSCPAGTGAAMANIWSEVSYNIGRISMYINCCTTPTLTASNTSPICSGQSLSFDAVPNPTGTNYTYSWTGPNNFTSTLQNPTIPSPTLLAAGTYTVTLTVPNCGTSNATTTVTVNPGPAVTATPATICAGGSTTLTASSAVAGGTYNWLLNGTSIGNTASVTVSPTTTTTYNVEYTANGCTGTNTVTVTVEQTPQPVVTVDSVCIGSTGTLYVNNVSAGGSYLWSTGATTASLSAAPTTTTNYSVVFTSVNGCVSPSVSNNIVVKPYPVITGANDTICIGSSTTLATTVDLPGGTYSWAPIAAASSNVTVAPTTTTTYTVIYNLLNCQDTAQMTVLVNPIPVAQTSNGVICFGDSIDLVATANLPGGSYLWNNGVANDTNTVWPGTSTNYSVTYTLNNCTSPAVTAQVTVHPIPVVTMNGATICATDPVTITATPDLLGGTYAWGPNAVNGGSIQTFTPLQDTTLTVVYTLNNCPSLPESATVIVNPLPVVTFSATPVEGCAPLSVQFTAVDQTNATYSWSTSNALGASGAAPTMVFPVGGTFDVTLAATTALGCYAIHTEPAFIYVEDLPVAAFESPINVFTQEAQYVMFSNQSLGATNYVWDFGDAQTSNDFEPSHVFQNTMNGYTITLTALTDLQCSDATTVSIGYQYNELVYIPNSFTPDGDLNNQVFCPVFFSGYDPANYELTIYNRWGEVIFESHNALVGWDGSYGPDGIDAPLGLYNYRIVYKNPDLDERKVLTGHVNLLR